MHEEDLPQIYVGFMIVASVFVSSYDASLVDSMGHDIPVSSTSKLFLFCGVT